jgi:uncharacterized protein involved in response to NO
MRALSPKSVNDVRRIAAVKLHDRRWTALSKNGNSNTTIEGKSNRGEDAAMATAAQTLRAYQGPAIFSYGFRPFFLGGAIWAAAAMVLFILMLHGMVTLPTAFDVVDWHVHELLYGFLPAIIAGFLLTAVPNWTGRLPVAGTPLAGLFTIWLAGRIAVAASALIGWVAAAMVDTFFLISLSVIVGREILAGSNKRNLKVLLLVSLLAAGNLVFHIEAGTAGSADYSKRIGIAAAILLIALIGGRIVPSFTRNWLAKSGHGTLPAPFGKFDLAAIAASAIALLCWIIIPDHSLTTGLCALAGSLNWIRVWRWKGYRTLAEPLVTILHAGYVFVPIGFLLMAGATAFPASVPQAAAVHAWTAGCIGLMTLAVMTRASLGHTGQPLTASNWVMGIYLAAILGAAARILAAFGVMSLPMLTVAAIGWTLAFSGFSFVFAPLLTIAVPSSRRSD